MDSIQLADGALNIEATLIATDLGLNPTQVLDSMRAGRLTAVCERGMAEDAGRFRLTFYYANRRLRLTVDSAGKVLERSATRLHRRAPGTPKRGPGGSCP